MNLAAALAELEEIWLVDAAMPSRKKRAVYHDEAELDVGDWFACDCPERPFEQGHTVFLSSCYPCRLALRGAVINGYADIERCADARELRTLAELSAAWGTL